MKCSFRFYKFSTSICRSCGHCMPQSKKIFEDFGGIKTKPFVCDFNPEKILFFDLNGVDGIVWVSRIPEECVKKVEIYATTEYDHLAELIDNED